MMDYATASPAEIRRLARQGKIDFPTTGMANGYAQGNLVVLEKALTWDFCCFASETRNPVLFWRFRTQVAAVFRCLRRAATLPPTCHATASTKKGVLVEETTDVSEYFADESRQLVSFLIGCSFSFESALLEADIPVRQIEESVNVPMYNTKILCTPAGVFSGNMVVSMRPIPHSQVSAAVAITAGMPRVHGASVQIGSPEAIGIRDIATPDFGDAVTIKPGKVPVFWPCGVTPQAVVMHSKPDFAITHAPGHMFVTDVKSTLLKL